VTPRSSFIQGPAGTGKTTFAIRHVRAWLDDGVSPERILVLVPQRTLGQPYNLAFAGADWPVGAQTDIATLGGLARRGLEIFWPLVSEKAGFAQPRREPTFLTIETAQYYMAQFVNEDVKGGIFDSVSITPFDIMRQTLDNLSKAAVNDFPLDDIPGRLTAAWGGRHSSRPPVYHASAALAQRFRDHCLAFNLLDFSLQIELYMKYLLHERLYSDYFKERYRYLVADNLDESFPVVADFIRWAWDDLESALLVYDTDAGYRIFLGADPAGMVELAGLCSDVQDWSDSVNVAPPLAALAESLYALFDAGREPPPHLPANPRAGFTYAAHRFYPQMVDWAIDQIAALIDEGVSPREIVVLAPFLGDSLRFALTTRLEERGIPAISHRPSRAVRDEPAVRALLTLTTLAHPEWDYRPPVLDVADALGQAIPELDPVRAWLLAQIVYSPVREALGTFDAVRATVQQRITYVAGEKYEHLRGWLLDYHAEEVEIPPDHFLSRLFGEVLAQPGYGFHGDLEAGRIISELVGSARKFRQTLYPDGVENWRAVSRNYVDLVQEGLLAALYVASWRDEQKDAVFLAPAYTFLMRNRWVDYQFWLDVGSNSWWERLEQPLTHPYVLSRNYPSRQVWTDEMETDARQAALRRLLLGLVRRCRKQVYVGIANLGEQGYEQRGPLLGIIQQIVQRYPEREPDRVPDEAES
jgi:hypothetical protein